MELETVKTVNEGKRGGDVGAAWGHPTPTVSRKRQGAGDGNDEARLARRSFSVKVIGGGPVAGPGRVTYGRVLAPDISS